MNHMIERRNRRLGITQEEEAMDPQIALLTEIRDALQAGPQPHATGRERQRAKGLGLAAAPGAAGRHQNQSTSAGSSARCCFTVWASSSAVACAVAMSAASTITRTTGSVPDGRSSTRPVSPSSRFGSLDGSCERLVGLDGALVHALDVDQDLGQLGHQPGQLLQRAARCVASCAANCRPVSTPSPVVAWSAEDHVAGLLAAQDVAAVAHVPPARSGRPPRFPRC